MDIFFIVFFLFRLLPVLLVVILTVAPLFNTNLRGFVYLVGTVLSVYFTSAFGALIGPSLLGSAPGLGTAASCRTPFTDAQLAGTIRSPTYLPLDLAVLGATAGNLVFSMTTNGVVLFNSATLLLLAVAILGTAAWTVSNRCFSWGAVLVALLLSTGLGAAWAALVRDQMPDMQYLFAPSNRVVCYRKNDRTFSCADTDSSGRIT